MKRLRLIATKMIKVDKEVFEALQAKANPLTDTPNSVLRRILGLEELKRE